MKNAKIWLKVKTGDGARIESNCEMPDADAFAIYMLYAWRNSRQEPEDSPELMEFKSAVRIFQEASAKWQAASDKS